jgi:hypothetical protein
MNVRHCDPRDMKWRHEPLAYRVYFWRPLGGTTERPADIGIPYESDEFELTDARNVMEVIEWANADSAGRTYTLYAVSEDGVGGRRGMIHLAGVDPTVAP